MKRHFLKLLGATLASVLLGAAAMAQDYPAKPIRLVAPFAPGGAVDILARIIGERLSTQYGHNVIVDNKPGASGHLGAQLVAKAPGDGYTLMVGTIGIHAAYASYSKLTYKPSSELQPVLVIGEAPNVVLVPANSKYKTFADFLADAKANAGKINYASAGAGSSVHMVTELFQLAIGQRMNHVPYKGSGPALIDLISGQVDVMFDNMSSGMPHVHSGKLRVLAVTGPKRDPRLPEVPTIAEAGVPGYSGTSWFTLAAPASMPAALVARLNQDVQRVLASPEVVARYDKMGMNYTPNSPAEAAAFFKSETEKWTRVIEAARIQLD
ncbi:tripartite tricarboxylate transporter substrate binding protein [Rhodoferax sp. BAB1]|uniref:Bug family tripartite tricarboxylate transporter substrate binding protein n=1 Tax=Rhodoferax sp. BAB1 TaxID=2741720 RepID=UPI0015774F7E|nr:tripartite tricarboxylate transporter substrate binding protein [Rhodoferax sp. BAB1]QKO23557.1 tripartite tricarboxylate transporter substrate binding protein [Rhodoferax sp. BAB1]